ncbi:MAG: hypothetical protein EOO10_21460, partial [Chitinophagaceae bacterium]
MQTKNLIRIGINLLTLSSTNVTLEKASKYRVNLLFKLSMYLTILGVLITLLVLINIPLFHWPKNFLGWLCLVALGVAPIYFLVRIFLLYYNELRPYQISQTDALMFVNGKKFAPQSQTYLAVKKKVGWQGLSVNYAIQLKSKAKSLTLSGGNTADVEAIEVASLISNQFGL